MNNKQFIDNIQFLGFRYFKLKMKPNQFSQRALMRALGYSKSGASFIQWRKGSVPGEEKLKKLCERITRLVYEKEHLSVEITPEILCNDSIDAVFENAQKHELANIVSGLDSCELTQKEKILIALLRLLENKSEYHDLIEMLDTMIKLLSLQIDDNLPASEKHINEFETIRTILLSWIQPKIKI
ncbi:MAG: hypothetical protein ISR90_07140 [Candidatus Marinimicrobia bacterium]|nr:hypothetical protein [Candidatus Neomarinimicrobiota bacterium]